MVKKTVSHRKTFIGAGRLFVVLVMTLAIMIGLSEVVVAQITNSSVDDRIMGAQKPLIIAEVFFDATNTDWETFFAQTFPRLQQKFLQGTQTIVQFRFHHKINSANSNSVRVAYAVECAAAHGQFLPYVERVAAGYTTQTQLVEQAAIIGIDKRSFENCLTSSMTGRNPAITSAVSRDLQLASTRTSVNQYNSASLYSTQQHPSSVIGSGWCSPGGNYGLSPTEQVGQWEIMIDGVRGQCLIRSRYQQRSATSFDLRLSPGNNLVSIPVTVAANNASNQTNASPPSTHRNGTSIPAGALYGFFQSPSSALGSVAIFGYGGGWFSGQRYLDCISPYYTPSPSHFIPRALVNNSRWVTQQMPFPNQGYLVTVSQRCSIAFGGYPAEEPVTLTPGWNIIGAPLEPTNIGAMLLGCNVRRGPLTIENNRYVQAQLSTAGKGYFVNVANTCTMKLIG